MDESITCKTGVNQMKGSQNVRMENDIKINIGSLNLKKALFLKAQQYIGKRPYQEINQLMKEVLKAGSYQVKCMEDGNISHLIESEHLCIELDSTAKHIINIYEKLSKKKSQSVQKSSQKESRIKLVSLNEEKAPEKKFRIEESFIEQSLIVLYQKLVELEDYKHQMNKTLSTTDKEISRIYHELETTNFNASQGYLFAKSLQGLLRKRRFIKTELDKIKSTNNELQQIKELVQQSEEKVLKQQNKYETYAQGWVDSFNRWME